jgi:hypothetical protein
VFDEGPGTHRDAAHSQDAVARDGRAVPGNQARGGSVGVAQCGESEHGGTILCQQQTI